MNNLLKFKGSWRSYQKRILDNLDVHLSDDKLHIIAAPGAGKTTLGIEVISRLNAPTLILVPTNTIKNQWKERICNAFLDEKDYDVVSTDIKNPSYLTVITYQALLAAFCGEKDESNNETYEQNSEDDVSADLITSSTRFKQEKADEIVKILKFAKISLLCFDEAHHLRKEWWKALTYLVEELKPKQTLALTATPPYDVDLNEWSRYEGLCGEIDEVISIPELVKNGDLCPHQDFIYFSNLRKDEKELIEKHSQNIKQFLLKLKSDADLIKYLSNCDFVVASNNCVEKIFEDPDFYVSVISFLKYNDCKISKDFLKLFGAKEFEIPKFNINQAKLLLNGLLFYHCDEFSQIEDKLEDYRKLAHRLGLVYNKKIVLTDSAKIQKQVASSLGKLDSINEIVNLEVNSLDKSLRMVILADYIKADDTDNTHLGVVPIWRLLKSNSKISLGVLCGSLILIPVNCLDALYRLLYENNIDKSCITVLKCNHDDNFVQINPKESVKHCIVALITELFNRGEMTVLIGTQALLGEGWDAPSINSLVLSSTVSSYMLSNQMRGRAIRIDKNNPNKISNIWHLASIGLPKDKLSFAEIFGTSNDIDEQDEQNALFHDLNQLSKRFEGFEAPGYYDKHEISNGIERILTKTKLQTMIALNKEKAFDYLNEITVKLAKDRIQTKQWWQDALYLGYGSPNRTMNSGIEADRLSVKTLCYSSYKEIIIAVIWTYLGIVANILPVWDGAYNLIMIITAGLCIILLYWFIKFLKTGTVAGVMKQIAIIHLEALSNANLIKTSLKNVGLSVVKEGEGIFVSCKNLPVEENNFFIKVLQEFFDPIENPRYVLIKKDKFLNIIKQTDYFAIPAVLSSNKKSVKLFEHLWKKYIGECEIQYTRNIEGRALLLKARKSAFSNNKRKKTKKLSKWQ